MNRLNWKSLKATLRSVKDYRSNAHCSKVKKTWQKIKKSWKQKESKNLKWKEHQKLKKEIEKRKCANLNKNCRTEWFCTQTEVNIFKLE